jgi:hypothetical protein
VSWFRRELPWKRSAKLWRQAAQVWRQTTIEHRATLDHLRKQLFERDHDMLALSMRLGEALERAKGLEAELNYLHGLVAWADRYLAQEEDDGGRRKVSND